MKKFPVFVFPVTLEFYLAARHTHKQLLTLYNPYEFAVSFKVLCTSPNKFTVIDPEGVVAPQSCIDIIIRYTQPTIAHCNAIDKFRITMLDRTTQQVLGKRDIPATYIEGEPNNVSSECTGDNFQPMLSKGNSTKSVDDSTLQSCTHAPYKEQQPVNLIAVAVSIFCIAALMLPTQQEPATTSSLPAVLHLTLHIKLVLAFMLGLVCMAVLRP